jgi:hypothetical protein
VIEVEPGQQRNDETLIRLGLLKEVDGKPVQCGKCGALFVSDGMLSRHGQRQHGASAVARGREEDPHADLATAEQLGNLRAFEAADEFAEKNIPLNLEKTKASQEAGKGRRASRSGEPAPTAGIRPTVGVHAMSNRLSKGKIRVGSLSVDTCGGVYGGQDRVCRKQKIITITAPGTSAETDTSWDLPTYAIVHDAYVLITSNSTAAGVLSVGLSSTSSGDADGFIYQQGTSSTGVFYPGPTFTAATSGDVITGNTRGQLLSVHATGSTQFEYGQYGATPYLSVGAATATEKSVTFTWKTTQTAPTGFLFIDYTEIA